METVVLIVLLNLIDQSDGDNMRKMADGADDRIVLLRIHADNMRFRAAKQGDEPAVRIFIDILIRGQDIISVLEQQRRSRLHARALRAGHRMAADKVHPAPRQLAGAAGNRRLRAPDIGHDAAWLHIQLMKTSQHRFQHADRGADKDIIRIPHGILQRGRGFIDDPRLMYFSVEEGFGEYPTT